MQKHLQISIDGPNVMRALTKAVQKEMSFWLILVHVVPIKPTTPLNLWNHSGQVLTVW